MVKKADATENHRHAIFIRGLNNRVIAGRAAWFQNIFDATGSGAIDAVSEREKGVRAEADGIRFGEPLALFIRG